MRKIGFWKYKIVVLVIAGILCLGGCSQGNDESDELQSYEESDGIADSRQDIFGVGQRDNKDSEWVKITYETKEENPLQQDMEDTIYKLQKRVEIYSIEAVVYQEGDRQIVVEMPKTDDSESILEELGRPGSLEFVTMKSDGSGETVLDGSDIEDAEAGTQRGQTGAKQYVVQLKLNGYGTEKFAEATAANIGKQIWIMYDEQQISAPYVQTVITDGKPVITGMESYEEAEQLAALIRIGGLSLELEMLEFEQIDP